MKPDCVRAVIESGVKGREAVRKELDCYFSHIVWSLEKTEWQAMSESERNKLVDIINQQCGGNK